MVWDTIDEAGQAARTRQHVADSVRLPAPQATTGVFGNFVPSAGNYFMRSMAEAGRAASMAFAAVPVALDKAVELQGLTHDTGAGTLSDRYFRWHDETFNRAVDYWTPKPQEVGAAGQVVGQVVGGVVQFLANPALMLGTAQLSTAEDLVRQGVDADAAVLAGDVAGIASAIGIALPAAFGKTLAARVASGAAGNLATNIPEAAIKREIVRAAGAPETVAQQFDPFDMKARAVDILLGAAFGAKAHWDARLTPAQRDAMAVQAQALHLEEASSPGRPVKPADLTATVTATRAAIDQMLRGEPVQVDGLLRGIEVADSPAKAAARAEIEATTREALADVPTGKPIDMPRMAEIEPPKAPAEGEPKVEVTPEQARAAAVLTRYPDLRLATLDAEGNPRATDAAAFLRDTEAEAARTQTNAAALLRTAASCLLGAI